jgi:outer membrane receptor protein involved in Fe transport
MLLTMLAQAVAVATAEPPAAQQGVVSYGRDFFAAYRPDTAYDMVQRLPGFSLDVGSGVRGYEGAAGNVLIDGRRPATKADGVDELLRRMPAGAVERIDLIRGGAPGIDMQGKSVLANVIRKSGGGAHGAITLGKETADNGQQAVALRAEASGQFGPRTWEAALYTGHFLDDSLGDGSRTRIDAAGRTLLAGRIHSEGVAGQVLLGGAVETPFAGGQLRLNARLFSKPYDLNETDFIRQPDVHAETEHDDDNVHSHEFGARYARAFGARVSAEFVALRQDKHEIVAADFRAPGDAELFKLDNRTAESIVRGVVKFQQRPALSWEAGAEGAYNTLTSQTRFSLNGSPVRLPAANVTVEEKRGEAFGKGVWRPTATVTIEAGAREEGSQISSSGDVVLRKSLYFTKPRLAVTWAPDPDDQVRLRYERVVGQLDFNAFVASQSLSAGVLTAGNPNLEPEKDWVSEIAYERRFWSGGALVLTARHFQITDVVDRAPFGAFDAPANIGAGTKDEEEAALTLPLDKLGLKGAQIRFDSTWRQSAVIDPTTRREREITALHPVDWNAHFTQDLPSLKLSWGLDIFGDQRERYFRFNEVQTYKVEAYYTPILEWKPRSDLTLHFEIENLTKRGFKRTLDHFAGSRATSPLAFVEDRDPHFGRVFFVRLRKTFGA